jgi:hypothetical protein
MPSAAPALAALALLAITRSVLAQGDARPPPVATPDAPRAAVAGAGTAEPSPDAAFADRLLDDGTLAPDIEAADPRLQPRAADGWPRSLSVATRAQAQQLSGGTRESSLATQLRATLDTPNHGALGLEASLRWHHERSEAAFGAARGTPAASFALAQRQMPLDGGWQASHFAGAIAALNTELAREAPRLGVPTRWLRGAAGAWTQPALGLHLNVSLGDGGRYDTLGAGGLARDGSRLRVAGLQFDRPVPGARGDWSYGAQIESHTAADAAEALAVPGGEALWQSLRWRGALGGPLGGGEVDGTPGARPAAVQLQWLDSRGAGLRGRAAWLDAALDDGPVAHRLGLQRLAQGAQWLGATVGAGTESLMYRWRWRTRRDVLELQFDGQHPLAGGGVTRQLWASGRHQLDLRDALGAQLTRLDAPSGQAWQGFAYVDAQREAEHWRGFAGAGRDAQGEELAQLGVDWSAERAAARWGASAALARVPGQAGAVLDATGSVGGRVAARIGLDAGLRAVVAEGGEWLSHGLQLSAQWAFAPGWSLDAALALSRSRAFVAPSGPGGAAPSLAGEAPALEARSAWLGLRYDFAAGTPQRPIGGPATGGGAPLEGLLFLDANANGRLDPGESRAPNVTVVLDGRYGTRTDAEGRYRFPLVAAGTHHLGVISDNLPLPWQVPGDAGRAPGMAATVRVEIRAREPARVDLGAVREAP